MSPENTVSTANPTSSDPSQNIIYPTIIKPTIVPGAPEPPKAVPITPVMPIVVAEPVAIPAGMSPVAPNLSTATVPPASPLPQAAPMSPAIPAITTPNPVLAPASPTLVVPPVLSVPAPYQAPSSVPVPAVTTASIVANLFQPDIPKQPVNQLFAATTMPPPTATQMPAYLNAAALPTSKRNNFKKIALISASVLLLCSAAGVVLLKSGATKKNKSAVAVATTTTSTQTPAAAPAAPSPVTDDCLQEADFTMLPDKLPNVAYAKNSPSYHFIPLYFNTNSSTFSKSVDPQVVPKNKERIKALVDFINTNKDKNFTIELIAKEYPAQKEDPANANLQAVVVTQLLQDAGLTNTNPVNIMEPVLNATGSDTNHVDIYINSTCHGIYPKGYTATHNYYSLFDTIS